MGNDPKLVLAITALLAAPVAAQIDWQSVAGGAPTARDGAAAVADLARDEFVLFGGRDALGAVLGDTWSFDGAAWIAKGVVGSTPSARRDHALAYDPARARIVLFGGVGASGAVLGDTWEWDGQVWSQRLTASQPVARQASAMATAPGGGVVLFGGADASGASLGDTWRLDATGWTRLFPPLAPAARFAHAMAFDPIRGYDVLFGGQVSDTDVWEWDGTAWTRRSAAFGPGPRARHAMAFDPVRERMVCFGGATATAFATSDVWEWDGGAWRQRAPSPQPTPRLDAAFAFDPVRGRCLMFGGLDAIGSLGDTWSLGTDWPAGIAAFGSGCAGALGPPVLDVAGGTRPWAGESVVLEASVLAPGAVPVFSGGFSNTMTGGVPLPIALDAIGMPGCRLLVSQDAAALAANVGGTAVLSIPLPTLPGLAGAEVYFQAAAYEPGANALSVVVSNGLTLTLGTR